MIKRPKEDSEQLSLFSLQNSSDNTNGNFTDNLISQVESLGKKNSQPSNIGAAKVHYINSKSLLTTSSGFIGLYKFTLNPYTGCTFACDYCYARFFAATFDEQNTWGDWVKVKENAVDLLKRARRAKSVERRLQEGDTIYMSSVTDPYQPIEHKAGLTRRILEELIEIQPRITIQTRSPIALRDIDLFRKFKHIRINFTVTTDSEDVRLRYEPHCPAIEVRLKAAKQVAEAGIPIGISISPMLPIKDVERFGQRVADLKAAEYVTQFFKPTRSRFSAGSSPESLQKMKEDNWTQEKYQEVRKTLINILGTEYPLLEGNEGYAPA
ncbi:SPL family radical SAM protein [Aetokthonos hydrillicola]|uniref:SPL family radical SAM protein n=1 Tax=Aetokthonos hydrillicola TaxID=1550245 RepID=UPI001ABAD161